MRKYVVKITCPDCTGIDSLGCFDGGYGYLENDFFEVETFDTIAEAERAWDKAWDGDHGIWEFEIVEAS